MAHSMGVGVTHKLVLSSLLSGCGWFSTAPVCPSPLVPTAGLCCFEGQTGGAACRGTPTRCPSGWTAAADGCRASLGPIESVVIPAGSFEMGCDPEIHGDCEADSTPAHKVSLRMPLVVMTHELTQAQYRALTGAQPSRMGGCDDCPVEQVSWYDAVAAANLLSVHEGLQPVYRIDGETVAADLTVSGWRLPTEAEWEYAARGGEGWTYAGSEDRDEVAWWEGSNEGRPSPVKRKKPNAFGLYDMSGNVWEWTADRPGPFSSEPVVDPIGPEVAVLSQPDPSSRGDERVLRGGAWADTPGGTRVVARGWITARHTDVVLGFRLVRRG